MASWDMTATGTLHRTPRHPWRWVGWLLLSFVCAALAVLFVPELALWLPRSLGY